MKKVCLTLCLLVLMVLSIGSTPAFAASWYYVGNSNNGTESVYIDNSSVIKNNRKAIVWVKWITSENKKSLQRVYYTRRPKTFTILSFTTYDADGNVIDNVLKLRTPETLMRQGFIRFSDIRHHHIMHTVSGTFPIDPAVLP